MTKQGDETRPEPQPEAGAVLKTEGEDVARAYVASVVPEGGEHPTIEVDRVRIVPPTRTPTVRLADVPKGSGPRAPDQMVWSAPKGPVELPDGRPVTKMQRIVVDSEVLIELSRRLDEGETRTVGEDEEGEQSEKEEPAEPAEVHAAEATPIVPVSTPVVVKKPARKPVLMVVAIAVTAGVVAVAAMRPPVPATSPAPSATVPVTPSATAPVTPSARPAPPPSTVPSAVATPSAVPSSQGTWPPRRQRSDDDNPYDAAATTSPPKTTAPTVTAASPPPAPDKTTTNTPTAAPTAGKIPEF